MTEKNKLLKKKKERKQEESMVKEKKNVQTFRWIEERIPQN